MTLSRNYLPLALAVVIGIANGYYAFNPSFQELRGQREQDIHGRPLSQQHDEQGRISSPEGSLTDRDTSSQNSQSRS
ncbi:hypothetical protein VTK73DRAFT_126 [Phialemonium thermophilum]|uniref:Uncharacterized protein n=1 Tax=Phialemonium thermophilum TaxID=223376 RepID=A0ABR3Y439_9PEZI